MTKWSQKYKKSIDCDNPKGFSQKAHCAGKKKKMVEGFKEYMNLVKSLLPKSMRALLEVLKYHRFPLGEGALTSDYIST